MANTIGKSNQKILQCDEASQYTGRIYPREEVETAVAAYQKKIEDGSAYGTLGTSFDNAGEMNISNISHKVTAISVNEHGEVIAEVEILDTPAGERVMALAESGLRLSPSMSGMVNDDQIARDLTLFYTTWVPESS